MSYTLPKKTLLLWQIRITVLFLLIIAAVLIFVHLWVFLIICLAVLAICFSLTAFYYLPRALNAYSIEVKGEAVIVKYGVFFKVEQIMPFARSVYAVRITTPLSFKMGLCALKIKAVRSSVFVAEVSREDAEELAQVFGND